MTYLAVSRDGLSFDALPGALGTFYFRVFEHKGWHYALAKRGNDGAVWYRSKDGLSAFEEGPRVLPLVRHTALWKHDGKLYIFFTRGQDAPEHIMACRIENLDDDWREWKLSTPQSVLKPEKEWEGAKQPIQPSKFGATYDFVHQLRDPAIYEEDGKLYLLYSAAGEHSIGIARIALEE